MERQDRQIPRIGWLGMILNLIFWGGVIVVITRCAPEYRPAGEGSPCGRCHREPPSRPVGAP